MDADNVPSEVTTLRTLVREQRELLEQLESRLAEDGARPSSEFVRRALSTKPARVARNEVRRAARRVQAHTDHVVPIAWPTGEPWQNRDTAELAAARLYTWRRTDEAAEALVAGDYEWASGALTDILVTEQALQIVTDDILLPPHWRSLGDDLSRASDMIVDALREQLAAMEGPSKLARVRTGQSAWIRAWRPFLLVVGHDHHGKSGTN